MSHAHMTQKAHDVLIANVEKFEDVVGNLQMDGDLDVGESTADRVYTILDILKNEIKIISVENR